MPPRTVTAPSHLLDRRRRFRSPVLSRLGPIDHGFRSWVNRILPDLLLKTRWP